MFERSLGTAFDRRPPIDISSKPGRAIGDASVAWAGCSPAVGLEGSAPVSVSPDERTVSDFTARVKSGFAWRGFSVWPKINESTGGVHRTNLSDLNVVSGRLRYGH